MLHSEYNSIVVHGGLVPGVPLEKQDPWMVMNIRSINAQGKVSAHSVMCMCVYNWYSMRVYNVP